MILILGVKPESDRGAYRQAADKVTEAGPGAHAPTTHRAGFGRGAPQQQPPQ